MKKTKHRSKISEAFTLIELLIVIAIIGLLMALAAPSTIGALRASRLTTAGNTLLFKVSQAQQTAISNNVPVSIRLYSYEAQGVTAYRAFQLFKYDASTNLTTPMEDPVYLGDGSIAMEEGNLSPLLKSSAQGTNEGAWPKDADSEPFKSMNAKYIRIVLFPDGSTNLSIPLRESYLTLVSDQEIGNSTSTPPPNYYTIQIDPITGSVRSYRPE